MYIKKLRTTFPYFYLIIAKLVLPLCNWCLAFLT